MKFIYLSKRSNKRKFINKLDTIIKSGLLLEIPVDNFGTKVYESL